MELATGTVVKSHGVRGDLVVDVRTDSPEERFAVGTTITLRHTSCLLYTSPSPRDCRWYLVCRVDVPRGSLSLIHI